VARNVARVLAGHNVRLVQARGNKEEWAMPLASQCEAGNVWLVKGPWVREFVGQALLFPAAARDDMVDSAAYAFNELAGRVPVHIL
jgi:predicted phage terminase large subunit-like protein